MKNSINSLSSIITRLGVNSVQNYILTLGRELSGIKNDPTKVNMSAIIDFGSEVLQYMLDKELVKKEGHSSTKSSDRVVIDIVPNITIDDLVDEYVRSYPIRTEHSSRLKSDEILHSCDIARIGKLNASLLQQQNNIPILVRKCNIKGSKRLPKNIANKDNPNYLLETKLLKEFIQEYDERTIFMNHSYDRRGRLYSMSYPLSFQSDEMTRASLELAFKEVVNDEGLKWLKLDIANLCGMDKYTTSSRLEWFEQAEPSIIACGRTGKYDRRLSIFKDIDKPIRLVSACKAYVDSLDGKPIGYMSSIDSTASGSQLMALITRDKKAATYTNLSSEDKRYDIYSEVAKEFYRLKGETNRFAYLSDRKRFKESVMISGYNGKRKVEEHFPLEDERVLFYEALKNTCFGMWELTELVNQAYLDNADKPYMAWTAIDGFECVVPQFKPIWKSVSSKDFDCMFKYEVIAPYIKGNKRSLLPNFIHSM